mmetsp:Transcript_15612/g.23947  ORF Transcript_15612/g.23947 Transcript_15612/m.23947 type:complete len:88 (+) Transcript_15612:381-644(+)
MDWKNPKKEGIPLGPMTSPFERNRISSFYSKRHQKMKKKANPAPKNPLLGLNKDILNVTNYSFEEKQDNLKKLLSTLSKSRKQSQDH